MIESRSPMVLKIEHETRLSYSAPVTETVFEVRMAPPSDEDQTALSYQLRIEPAAPVTSYRDGFGNRVELFNVPAPYSALSVRATSYVRAHRRPAAERLRGVSWPAGPPANVDAMEYLRPSRLADEGPALAGFVAGLPRPGGPLLEALRGLMVAVRGHLEYEKRVTSAHTTLSEALALGRGVCQDFSHLFLGTCRRLGLPARYVSGYVHHPGEIATHAWCQVWAGERVGWVDVDPTANEFPGNDHVVVARGRDYADVPPNRGVWLGKAEESMAVLVTVEAVDHVPLEWDGWAPPMVRALAPTDPVRSRRQGRPRRGILAAYPNQPRAGVNLLRQQGQQQQQ
jgi:transglutaminase-like putative cysteine protease